MAPRRWIRRNVTCTRSNRRCRAPFDPSTASPIKTFWIGDPYTRGAYAYYKTGQYTAFCGVERIAEGDVHFCGEQTSLMWQGYINGAVESGERVAREILKPVARRSADRNCARSAYAQSRFASAICSGVRQAMSSRRGLQTRTARRPRARDRNVETIAFEEELDVARHVFAAGGRHRIEDDSRFLPLELVDRADLDVQARIEEAIEDRAGAARYRE